MPLRRYKTIEFSDVKYERIMQARRICEAALQAAKQQ